VTSWRQKAALEQVSWLVFAIVPCNPFSAGSIVNEDKANIINQNYFFK